MNPLTLIAAPVAVGLALWSKAAPEAVPFPTSTQVLAPDREAPSELPAPQVGMPIIVPATQGLTMPVMRSRGNFYMPLIRPDAATVLPPERTVPGSAAADTVAPAPE